jgi:hypothetical protein
MFAFDFAVYCVRAITEPADCELVCPSHVIHAVTALAVHLVESFSHSQDLVRLLSDFLASFFTGYDYGCHIPIAIHSNTQPKAIKVAIAIQW